MITQRTIKRYHGNIKLLKINSIAVILFKACVHARMFFVLLLTDVYLLNQI